MRSTSCFERLSYWTQSSQICLDKWTVSARNLPLSSFQALGAAVPSFSVGAGDSNSSLHVAQQVPNCLDLSKPTCLFWGLPSLTFFSERNWHLGVDFCFLPMTIATDYPVYHWKKCLEIIYCIFLLLGYFSWEISWVNLCLWYEFLWLIQKKSLLYVKESRPKAT